MAWHKMAASKGWQAGTADSRIGAALCKTVLCCAVQFAAESKLCKYVGLCYAGRYKLQLSQKSASTSAFALCLSFIVPCSASSCSAQVTHLSRACNGPVTANVLFRSQAADRAVKLRPAKTIVNRPGRAAECCPACNVQWHRQWSPHLSIVPFVHGVGFCKLGSI